ncbi:MAG: hypothetical protein M5U34_09610 [Chloroflexi bacterium]|nr:hypothetical protein [Chloroflexota bacterium]
MLIAELPRIIAAGNKNWWQGLQVTVYFAMFTIPMQFGISFALATILFQNLRGTTWFRMFFFFALHCPAHRHGPPPSASFFQVAPTPSSTA